MKTRDLRVLFLSLSFALSGAFLASCGDDSSSSGPEGDSSEELSSADGSSEGGSSAGGNSQDGNGSSGTVSSSSEEEVVLDDGLYLVRVKTYPEDPAIEIGPADRDTVAEGESFKAWARLPARAGDVKVFQHKVWNDPEYTIGDTVVLSAVRENTTLVDTVSVLEILRPAIGDAFAVGDSVTLEYVGTNLPNNVRVVVCPTRECAQNETVLSDLPAAGGTFKFAMPDQWPAGNEYYIQVIVNNNFWARVKNISVTGNTATNWTPLTLHSSITKALPMTGLLFGADNVPSGYDDAISLEFFYCYPALVVTGKSSSGKIQYDWSYVENMLEKVKNRGHQAVVRIAYENPSNVVVNPKVPGASGVPEYIKKDSVKYNHHETYCSNCDGKTYYADWRSEELKWFTKQFHRDFAAKYDKDPRIAFLETGFGHWSEYHVSGGVFNQTDTTKPLTFPPMEYQMEFVRHLDTVFHDLPWMLSVDAGSPANPPKTPYRAQAAETATLTFGLFDDSFMHGTHELSQGSGWNERCWQGLGYEDRWQRSPNGGEVSYYKYDDHPNEKPYDHLYFLSPDGVHGLTWADQARKYHVTFMLASNAPKGSYGTPTHFLNAALASGYKFRVTAFETDGTQVRATVTNEGVAPIYRDAYVAVDGIRASKSLKGLLPGESQTVKIPASGNSPTLTIESDHLVGRAIQYLADLN
ncbi:MAG: hypothetical protein J6Z50_08835 [Fibrobacterales bacterium]|nr:hypothetical protein [Fibrobacterales bacterium]